ncbi:restriction endonuclease subunit S [Riemerella anatipestifer]|uniref:restriction endonuclease subunit S n=1 Tax=Riemerella anatipestifer TaxID=34085 RepID=UPI0023648C9F|nr:restriction endonuclease subunit S [Riemerella anatipestifer]MDD1524848.1 restriction endonuclease subunit S [Riemerella anatipestifer]
MERVKLIDICKPKQWKTISGKDILEKGKYPVYGANGKIGFYNEYNHEKPTLLIGCRGSCGTIHISEPFSYTSGNAMALDGLSSKVDIKFLFYYLKQRGFDDVMSGGVQKQITKVGLEKVEIPLPPLVEQQAIAEKLDQAQKIIDLNEAEVARYDKLAQALFIDMFGDPVQNPKGWEMKKLGEITNKIGSGATPRGGKESYKEEGIALIRSMNVYDNRFFYKDLAFIDSAQADKLKNVCVEENDILFNITGASICRSTIVPKDVLPARVNQHVSIIRMKKSVATPLFVNHLLISASVKRSLLNIGSGGGAIMQAITKQGLEDFEIILPPITLQNEFAKRIEQIEILKNQAQQELEQSKNLFQSLLQESFKG